MAENKSLKRKRGGGNTNIQDSFLIKGPTLTKPSKLFSFLFSLSTRELTMTSCYYILLNAIFGSEILLHIDLEIFFLTREH